VALLTKILNQLAHFSPAVITDEEIEPYKRDFDILLNLGVFQKVSDPQHIWCKTCQNESVEVHYVKEGRAFTLCTQDEYAERDYFDPQTIKQWRFDTPPFISLFLKALGIDQASPTENIVGLLWDLGNHKINGKQYHLFFARSIDDIEKDKYSTITNLPDTAIFYLGTIHTSNDVLLVPVLGILKDINVGELIISSEVLNSYFPKEVFADEGGDVKLDKHIFHSHSRKILQLHKKKGGGFEKEIPISPQASYLIAYCYQIRSYDKNSKTLKELAVALTKNGSKVSISNRIKEIEKICSENGVKQILHKYSDEKWGLNQKLDCCKSIH